MPKSGWKIRTAKKSDFPAVIGLFMKAFSESPYNENWKKESAEKRLGGLYALNKEFCLVAEDKGAIVGLLFSRTQVWNDGLHLFIEDLAVGAAFRGRGVGTGLVLEIEAIAKSKGIVAIDLAMHRRAAAGKFWKKMGYDFDEYINLRKFLR